MRFECEGIFDEYPHAASSLAIKPPVGDVYPVVVSREETALRPGKIDGWHVVNAQGDILGTYYNGEFTPVQ